MERLKNITIIFLLAIGLLVPAALAKPPSVLLQEGLYAEEIEGDLDTAIKIYEQVIAEAKETQRIAAQATYRIGMCYLKKGEKGKAAGQFRKLIVKFPEHESLVTKAQEHLAKLKPPVTITGGFGPVMERVINDDGVGEDFMFDLDIGKSFSVSDAKKWGDAPDISEKKSLEDFVMKSGIDLFGETSKKSLMGIDMIAMPIHNERWDMSPEDVIEQVSMCKPGTPVALSADGQLPKTFVFKTGQGGMGILQIIEMQAGKAPRHFKIRYKMLQEPAKIAPVEVFGPVIERIIHSEETGKPFFFDLDTAKAFSPPPGLTRSSPEREVLEWSATKGIDFVNSRGHLELVEMTTVKVESDMWESATPAEIKDALLKGSTQNFLPTRSKDYTISSPITYVFKTREGGIGILQILEKKDNNLRIRYKMLQPQDGEAIVNLQVVEPKREWWRIEPTVTKALYEGDDLEIKWDVVLEPRSAGRTRAFAVGVLPIREDISDLGAHYYLEDNLAFTVRRTPYGKEWKVRQKTTSVTPKTLKPGEYKLYVCAFGTYRHGVSWSDRLTDVIGAGTAKLVVKPRPETHAFAPGYLKGLVGHWKFDEGRGSTAYDSAGSNDGTIHGAQWTGGRVNGALYFDSRDDYVSISPVVLSTNWTVSAWCQPLRNEVGGCNPIMGGSEDYDNYIILCEAKRHINLETDTEGDWVIVGRGVVDFNEWAHYTVTRNGNTVSAYKNGVYIDDATLPKGDENTITKIGSGYGCQTYYKGRIDDVRIYNRALSKQEVRSLYRSIVGSAGDERVTDFGPAKVARLYDIDHPTTTEKECAIDFDTGKLSKIPPQARQMPGDDLMKWLSGSGIDAVAEIAGKDRGLIGIDVAVKMLVSDEWDTITPQQLRALPAPTRAPRQDTKTMLFEDAPPQPIFSFRTRDSGLGILQILDVDKSKQMVQFRYKMLQGETAQLSVSSHKVFLPECDTTVYDLLDLASSRIINSEPGGEVLDLSKPDGKGNLYFDKAKGQLWLVGVRRTRMRLRSGGELLSSEPDFIARGRNAYYLLGEIPCQYLVTTAQGDKYELKVLSVETGDRPGVHIEYWKSAESPGTFDVATGVRGDAAKAMELLSGLKALMAGVFGAVESDDPNTALLLLDKLIAQSKQFKSTVKDTSVEAAVKAGIELLDPLRDALEKKQMDRVKSLLAVLNQMGPAVESAIEKEAAQQGQSKKRTDVRRR